MECIGNNSRYGTTIPSSSVFLTGPRPANKDSDDRRGVRRINARIRFREEDLINYE